MFANGRDLIEAAMRCATPAAAQMLGADPGVDLPSALDTPAAPSGAVEQALSVSLLVLFPLGAWTYWRMLRRTFAGHGQVRTALLGWPEAFVALLLTGCLIALIVAGFLSGGTDKGDPAGPLIVTGVLFDSLFKILLVAGMLLGLATRGIRVEASFGFDRLSLGAAIGRGVAFLLLALPLVYGAMWLSQRYGGMHQPTEEAVRLFRAGQSLPPKLAIILSAVVVAPVVEETIFRGYLYAVTRRFLGAPAGLLFNAALFAGIHLNVPSLGGLFILAVCLTLAYEATGSLLVPMTMHALFNTISIASMIVGEG